MKISSEVGYIETPQYISEVFNRKLTGGEGDSERGTKMRERVFMLMADALKYLENADWEIAGTKYKSPVINEPLGIEDDGVMTYIYGEEKGRKVPLAIFKNNHMAAEYFVWLVSKGKREINWELFLDMVP